MKIYQSIYICLIIYLLCLIAITLWAENNQVPQTSEKPSSEPETPVEGDLAGQNQIEETVKINLRWFLQEDRILIEAYDKENDIKKKVEDSTSKPEYNKEKEDVINLITGGEKGLEKLQQILGITPADGQPGPKTWEAFLAHLTQKAHEYRLGNRIVIFQPPQEGKIIKNLTAEIDKLRKPIFGNRDEINSNKGRIETLEKKEPPKLPLVLRWVNFAALILGLVGIAVYVLIIKRKKDKQDEGLEDTDQKLEELENLIKSREEEIKKLQGQIGTLERIPVLMSKLQTQQAELHGKINQQLTGITTTIESFDKFASEREEQIRQSQSAKIDLEQLDALQKDLAYFDETLNAIEELLQSNRQDFSEAKKQQVTSVLQKVNAIYEFQTNPQDETTDKSLAEHFANALKMDLQPEKSFESLRKQVNFKALAQFFARHIDDEYRNSTQNEASIEAKFNQLLQSVGLTEIRPKAGDRYNPRYHHILREERRPEVQRGAIARTHLRGFLENGEVISKAQVIMGR